MLQQCDKCGAVSWGQRQGVSCLVFLRGAAVNTAFVSYSCTADGCDGKLHADGIEYGVLRKTPQLAFGHDLLYAWVDLVTSHRCVTFLGFWHDTLMAYKR